MEESEQHTKNLEISDWCSSYVLEFLNDVAGRLSSHSVRKAVLRQLFQNLLDGINSVLEVRQAQLTKKGSEQILVDVLFLRIVLKDYFLPKTEYCVNVLVDNLVHSLNFEKEYVDQIKQHILGNLSKKYAIETRHLV